MFNPEWPTFSADIDRLAAALQPTTLHSCPLSTLPMEINLDEYSRLKNLIRLRGQPLSFAKCP
jgi:hypothetical protein